MFLMEDKTLGLYTKEFVKPVDMTNYLHQLRISARNRGHHPVSKDMSVRKDSIKLNPKIGMVSVYDNGVMRVSFTGKPDILATSMLREAKTHGREIVKFVLVGLYKGPLDLEELMFSKKWWYPKKDLETTSVWVDQHEARFQIAWMLVCKGHVVSLQGLRVTPDLKHMLALYPDNLVTNVG